MSVSFRGGRGNMRCAGEFSCEIANVANSNGILILKQLEIEPYTDAGLVGNVRMSDFIKKCSAWINSPHGNSPDEIYLTKKISGIMTNAIELSTGKDPFTHFCWS